MERRDFLAAVPVIALLSQSQTLAQPSLISSNSYNWITFYRREGREWNINPDEDFKTYKTSGLQACEPGIADPAEANRIVAAMSKYDIKMPSIYIGSVLHDKVEIENAVSNILAIADIVKKYGTKIIVTNPNPIKWDGDELKSDEQLKLQAVALDRIGKGLKAKGMKLAYHTHDMEMKAGAREFHHMMQNTSPDLVHFCMDVHWVYRGSKNSQLAVFDVLKMYGHRIIELHIRQSTNGIWQETFTAKGDIDYNRFANELRKRKINPHLVIEQCVEAKSPNSMKAVEAHIIDLKEVTRTFVK